MTKNSDEYKCWIKKGYKESPDDYKCQDYNEFDDTDKYGKLFTQNDFCTIINSFKIIIYDGSTVMTIFEDSINEILDAQSSNANTILVIHFGEGGGLEEFPKTKAIIFDSFIKNYKLGIYFAYSVGKNQPEGIEDIFNKIAKKDISADDVEKEFEELFQLFRLEARKKKYENRVNQIADLQLLLSSYLLLESIGGKMKIVSKKQNKIQSQIKAEAKKFNKQEAITSIEFKPIVENSFTSNACLELNQKLNNDKNRLIDEYTESLKRSA